MLRQCALIGLAIFAVTAFGAGGHRRTILVDNFNDGDSEGWEENDFTAGRGTFTVVDGEYVLETTEPIPVDDPSVGALDADWEPSEDNPVFAHGTIRARVRANTYGTSVGLLLRDSHETESDYGFYGSTSFGTFYIERFELFAHPEAPQTIIAMADPDEFPFEVGQDYIIEASVIGHRLEMKAWKVGEREPKRAMLKVKDRVLGPDEGTGIAAIAIFDPAPLMMEGVTAVDVSATVDNITFTPARVKRGNGRDGHDDDDEGDEGDDD